MPQISSPAAGRHFLWNKKGARSQASPPAAGRLISPILFQPMAILAERFYVIKKDSCFRTLVFPKNHSGSCLSLFQLIPQ
jgi:hypothetical protein